MIYNRRRYAIFLAAAAMYIQNNKLFMETADEISVGRSVYPRRNLIIIIIIWVTFVSLPNSSRPHFSPCSLSLPAYPPTTILLLLRMRPQRLWITFNSQQTRITYYTFPHIHNSELPQPSLGTITTWILTDAGVFIICHISMYTITRSSYIRAFLWFLFFVRGLHV